MVFDKEAHFILSLLLYDMYHNVI